MIRMRVYAESTITKSWECCLAVVKPFEHSRRVLGAIGGAGMGILESGKAT